MLTALYESSIHSLPLLARGKVRENYAVGQDLMLMVATDRLSAFDVIMNEPIPEKGQILSQMAQFWFEKLKSIVPNHLSGIDPATVVSANEVEQVRGRSMVVKKLKPVMIEAVVRGYLAGSGWKEYQQTGGICGIRLPPRLELASQLPEAIFTPATKAPAGEHDQNISFSSMSNLIGLELADQICTISLRLYAQAAEFALTKGIIIADTKFEFGLDEYGTLTLMDEVLTPDSSRFWALEAWQVGVSPPSYDKQFVRDWLEAWRDANGNPWPKTAPAPHLPVGIIEQTTAKYRQVYERLTDKVFV
ncbi:MAG: phosphoribosylaminoimidazolesuccinocarboxamide synthase [Burkholderiaceae bacterium]|nr:phosphoribosylaminoimidazolesuccinocarboxamide synthase [Burkholderiaceae bacterium]